ncbi:Actin-related protein [Artemisia annua]|uniref:Actin-related protein 6 n=1 Tax=Artemisia annua TaxID=35608 RepID=A0A2U1NIP3_ARTAN|nr:Actin-related protein [Artemisia annua]
MPPPPSTVVVLDNGAGYIKAGTSGERSPSLTLPNCTAKPPSSKKPLLPAQLLSPTLDLTSATVRRPFDRGHLINPDLQTTIWAHIFDHLHINPIHSSLLLTEPLFTLPSLSRAVDEVVFEHFGFLSMFVSDGPSLVHLYEASKRPYDVVAKSGCSLVVDVGFSFGHVVPVVKDVVCNYGVKRMDLGGKALTNYLKELVSYRSVNVMDEVFLMDDVKEKLCFVSSDVERDLGIASHFDVPLRRAYFFELSIWSTYFKAPVELPKCTCHVRKINHHETNLKIASFGHVVPVVKDVVCNYGVKRMDLGGKALTNYLKELVSYRSVNVMDEVFLMDDVKEKLCFVSSDVERDLGIASHFDVPLRRAYFFELSIWSTYFKAPVELPKCTCHVRKINHHETNLKIARRRGNDNHFRCTYVLPDGITHTKGYVKDPEEAQKYLNLSEDGELQHAEGTDQADETEVTNKPSERNKVDLTKNEFSLSNERFLVPEMIFRPADLGMNQAGLAECIVRAVNSCHPHLHPVLYESIILTGGSTLFPGFTKRLPMLGAWRGGSLLASSPDFDAMCVTKAEYEELGSYRCRRRFFH